MSSNGLHGRARARPEETDIARHSLSGLPDVRGAKRNLAPRSRHGAKPSANASTLNSTPLLEQVERCSETKARTPFKQARQLRQTSEWLRPDQVEEIFGIKATTLAQDRCEGRYKISFSKLGRAVYYSREAIAHFLKSREQRSTSDVAGGANGQ